MAKLSSSRRSPGRRNLFRAQTHSLHRCVNQVSHQRAEIFALARALHHEHREHVFSRIDPEEGSGQSAPEELAERSWKRRHALMGADREAETEAVTGRHQERIDLDLGAEMIARHRSTASG